MRSEEMLCKKNACQKNVMYRNLTESFPQAFFSSEIIMMSVSQDTEVYGLIPSSCFIC